MKNLFEDSENIYEKNETDDDEIISDPYAVDNAFDVPLLKNLYINYTLTSEEIAELGSDMNTYGLRVEEMQDYYNYWTSLKYVGNAYTDMMKMNWRYNILNAEIRSLTAEQDARINLPNDYDDLPVASK